MRTNTIDRRSEESEEEEIPSPTNDKMISKHRRTAAAIVTPENGPIEIKTSRHSLSGNNSLPNASMRSGLFRQLKQAKDKNEIEQLVQKLLPLKECREYAIVLSAYGRAKDAMSALRLFDTLKNRDVITFNAAMSACEKGGYWEKTLSLIEEMVTYGLEPDVVSYNIAIAAYGQVKRLNEALKCLDIMRARALIPDRITYNTILLICEKCGDLDAALQLLPHVQNPDLITYNTIISTCAQSSQWEIALSLLGEMERDRGIIPNLQSFLLAISACASMGKWQPAYALYAELKSRGFRPSLAIYNATITSTIKNGHYPLAVSLFESLLLHPTGGIEPDHYAYYATISACANGGQWRRALSLLDECSTPNLMIYNAALSACHIASQPKEALRIFDHMKIQPDENTYNLLISTLAQYEPQRALHLFTNHFSHTMNNKHTSLRHNYFQPTLTSYNAALLACETAVFWKKALELLSELEANHLDPNETTYNTVISTLEKAQELDIAQAIFATALSRGVYPYLFYHSAPLVLGADLRHIPLQSVRTALRYL